MRLVIFILGILLFSSIGFSGSFDDTVNVISWNNTDGNWWNETLCIDIDVLSVNLDASSSDLLISCADGDADIECIDDDDGEIEAQHGRITYGKQAGYGTRDCVGLEWLTSTEDNGNVPMACYITSDGRYVNIAVFSGTGQKCGDVYIHLKNETQNPYLTTATRTETSRNIHIDTTGTRVNIYLVDNGYSTSDSLTGDWVFYPETANHDIELSTNTDTHAFYNSETNTDDTSNQVPCADVSGSLTGSSYWDINVPSGTYDLFCHNLSSDSKALGWNYSALKIINTSTTNLDLYYTIYSSAYVNIFNVYHYPAIPQPNMSVSVHWETTTETNSTLYWRTKPLGNWTSGWSSWVKQENTTTSLDHNIVIDGINILDIYQYQYYVMSSTTTDNNTDYYYNFTVGGVVLPDDYTYMYNATKNFTDALGVEQIVGVNLIAVFITMLSTLGSLLATHSLAIGGTVFVTAILLFSLMGFLPYYLFILIALAFTFIFVRLILGLFGNG